MTVPNQVSVVEKCRVRSGHNWRKTIPNPISCEIGNVYWNLALIAVASERTLSFLRSSLRRVERRSGIFKGTSADFCAKPSV